MKAKITIELNIPDDFKGVGPFGKEATLIDFINHWLYEGYFTQNGTIEIPNGVTLDDINITLPKEWSQ